MKPPRFQGPTVPTHHRWTGPPSIHSMASNTPDIEVLRDRVIRASEVRVSIGTLWNEYMERQPRRFGLVADAESGTAGLSYQHDRTDARTDQRPVRRWLYLLRAALDGTAYYVAVRDSGQNPPPNERSIYFPIKTDPAKYDSQGHRQGLIALSDSTFADLRTVQPFNASPTTSRTCCGGSKSWRVSTVTGMGTPWPRTS